jgi:hypothetical protein
MEPVWEVADAAEGERACAELRAHGIECELDRRLVVVPADDVLRALDLLEAWSTPEP